MLPFRVKAEGFSKIAMATILLIESERTNGSSFAIALEKKGFKVVRSCTLHNAKICIRNLSPDLVILDAASMRTSGARMCHTLSEALNGTPLILVSPEGSHPSTNSHATTKLNYPLTERKLINRVTRFLPDKEKDVLRAGHIEMNLTRRTVRCNGKIKRLTPQLMELLKELICHRGRLVTREYLMREIWQTEYMGDTRTLDVHISWLRKIIEPDPCSPKYLKTIRGLGYRLDIPS
jgi:DNA-binding response OmpR family regulator